MPRAGLTPLRVVQEAEALADEVGLPALTLVALADRLGVRMPSLYKHIGGMAALQRDIAVRAKTELAAVLGRAAVGRAGADALRAMSDAYRAWAIQHPGRYAATIPAPDPDDAENVQASNAIVGIALDVLAGFGLSGDDAIDATRTLRASLHGFVSLERTGGFGLPADINHSFDHLVSALVAAVASWTSSASAEPDNEEGSPP